MALSTNAGSPQTVNTGAVLLLTGSITQGVAPIRTTTWTQVSGPDCTMTYPSNLITPVYELSAGTYVFQLTALDKALVTASSTVTITVNSSGGTLYIPDPYPYNIE